MNPTKASLRDTIVDQAFDKYGDDVLAREAYVRERCAGDQDLLEAVLLDLKLEQSIREQRFLETLTGASRWSSIPKGTTIGEYVIEELIGSGGMGSVYKATQPRLERTVAIKVLHARLAASARHRFLAEARALGSVRSERVVHVYAYDEIAGQPYIAMEYIEGSNLLADIQSGRCADVAAKLAIAQQIAEALNDIHNAGIAHRDVKPSNVLIQPSGKIKLLDFGIAWRQDAHLTRAGQVVGTPAYMAPELILRKVGGGEAKESEAYRRTDIYSFGILLYELFTRRLPFTGDTWGEIEHQIVHEKVPIEPLSEQKVPRKAVELIKRLTAKDPQTRPSSFWEVAHDLENLAAHPEGDWKKARWLSWLAAAGFITAAAITWWLSERPDANKPAPNPVQVVKIQPDPVTPPTPSVTSSAHDVPAKSNSSQNVSAPSNRAPGKPVQFKPPAPPKRENPQIPEPALPESSTEAGLSSGPNVEVQPLSPPVGSLPNEHAAQARASATAEILRRIHDYATAFSHRDIAAVRRVRELTPDGLKTITAAFSQARSIEYLLNPEVPSFQPDGTAVVRCELRTRAVYHNGDIRSAHETITVTLRDTSRGWTIISMN